MKKKVKARKLREREKGRGREKRAKVDVLYRLTDKKRKRWLKKTL
jgi:hypothetical protein